jgi:hypothetical protein
MNISIGALVLAAVAVGQDDQVQVLQKIVHELREEVAELKNQNNESWISQQRANEIRTMVRDVLFDADVRANLVGDDSTAGFDAGGYFKSADGNWELQINGQLQTRWLYNKAVGKLSNSGFELRRTKIKLSGHIFDPSWTFKITPTWSRNGGTATEDAWIGKSFGNGAWLKIGQFNSKFLRENSVSSSAQLAAERSMVNNAFAYGWTQGLELGWKNEDTRVYIEYTDGPNGSNSQALNPSSEGLVIRGELLLGELDWKDFASFTSSRGSNSGILLGIAYENYDSNGDTIQYGNANINESNGLTLDASVRGDGWNIFAYTVETTGEVNATGVTQASSGWLVQGGAMVSDNTELFAQYQRGKIDNAVFSTGSNAMSAIRFGFNYWPTANSNNLKWTTDIAWARKALPDGLGSSASSADWATDGNGWRADSANETGQMLLRTQLQLLF